MKRVIFATSKRSRKPEFQIQTIAYKDGREIVFQKSALTPTSIPHTSSLKDNYKLLKKRGLHKQFAAITNPSKHSKGSLNFETLRGNNLETLFVEGVLADDNIRVAELLDFYTTFLDKLSLPKTATHKHNYNQAIFGPNLYEQFIDSECIFPGLLDLNFDNLMLNGSEIRAFDYEWSYNWCLPKDYVLSRSLMWFGIRHAELFKLHSRRVAFVAIRESVLLPRYILELFPGIERTINEAYSIEINHFQPWVTGISKKSASKEYVKPKAVSEKVLFSADRLDLQAQHIKILNAEITRLTQELNVANRDKELILQDIINIKTSISYQVASVLSKVKQASNRRPKKRS